MYQLSYSWLLHRTDRPYLCSTGWSKVKMSSPWVYNIRSSKETYPGGSCAYQSQRWNGHSGGKTWHWQWTWEWGDPQNINILIIGIFDHGMEMLQHGCVRGRSNILVLFCCPFGLCLSLLALTMSWDGLGCKAIYKLQNIQEISWDSADLNWTYLCITNDLDLITFTTRFCFGCR